MSPTYTPDDEPLYMRFWRERGGTPQKIPPELAPIPVTAGMRLWLRIDEDLAGGVDESGFPRPEALVEVLSWHQDAIMSWMTVMFGVEPSPREAFRVARRLLRDIGQGRAEARAEWFDQDDD